MIDLHTHTSCSDGTDSPRELMYAAREAGVQMVGLTDHDTISGWEEASSAVAATGVALVRGMELSTRFIYRERPLSVHMLAYLFNPDDANMRRHCVRMRNARIDRAKEMVERLARDVDITWEDVQEQAGEHGIIGRPHIADALISRGVVASREEAFERLLHPRHPYYVRQYAPQTCEAIEWIVDAGGRAVCAHPLAGHRGRTVPMWAFDRMREAGLFGVEVNHRDNPETERELLRSYIERLQLFPFGSSDYHGSGKPNVLGEYSTDRATVDALAQGAFLEVLRP
ncbi:PHP domain-containing protein [Trueperella sp. LYQ143]|uniref:PHP domain-containing protein n=1 Tax=unclassified Trueperella TaxID=2630174 RepID=UPI003983009C